MSHAQAPEIPNLLDKLRANRAPRLSRNHVTGPSTADATVQQTDTDAAVSRLSAIELGYLSDPYARSFFDESHEFVRRMPIINRGTHIRSTAIDRLVTRFLARHARAQIVSLGAGTDTRYFRLISSQPSLRECLIYHELDFPATTTKKIQSIRRSATLRTLLNEPEIKEDATGLRTPGYVIHGVDLRNLASSLSPLDLDPTRPTLLLSECCLTYLSSTTSTSLLQTFSNFFTTTPLSIILYEPIHPNDPFGRTMTANLASRGIALPGMLAYPTIASHVERLHEVGFESAQGWTTAAIWDDVAWISAVEKDRLRGLEMVDEEEEWVLLAGHYSVIYGEQCLT